MFFFNFEEDKLSNYYLAYFDILGYKSFFENEENPYEFLQVIENALEDVKKSVNIAHALNNIEIGLRVYSDNFLFYIKEDNNELQALTAFAYLLSLIQRRLLERYSLLIRGGISKGKFYHSDELIFGKGLIKVYTIESVYAIYPRIIIDKDNNVFSEETINALNNSGYIEKDEDGYYFIQYLTALGEDDNFRTISYNIKRLINNNCKYRNMIDPNKIKEKERLIAKYLWLITRYNNYFDKNNLLKNKIDFTAFINPRVLKVEVTCK